MSSEVRHLQNGLLAAVAGTLLIFSLVLGINEFAETGADDAPTDRTEFHVERPPEPPPPEPEPEPEPPAEDLAPEPPPPLADLDSAIGDVEIAVPGLDTRELDRLAGEGVGDGDVVMTGDSVDRPPRPVNQPPAEYPVGPKRRGVEGYVVLSVLIDREGRIEQLRVIESHPAGVFDEAARESVGRWRFEPAEYQGERVRVWARQRVRFELGGQG